MPNTALVGRLRYAGMENFLIGYICLHFIGMWSLEGGSVYPEVYGTVISILSIVCFGFWVQHYSLTSPDINLDTSTKLHLIILKHT